MKFSGQIRRMLLILPFLVISLSCFQGEGFMPFAGDDFFVKQGSAQCGPTSFYMIFRYYGDNTYPGEFTELPDCADVLPLQEDLAEVTSDSGVSRWLGVTSTGITAGNLKEKISRLSTDRNYPWYITEGDIQKTDTLQEERFSVIYNNYLRNDLPVIIHISRPAPLTGHYMVLVGFDPQHKNVYYIDPNRDMEAPVVQSVGLESFLDKQWYESPDNPLIPYGYWDGTWIGFRHEQ